MESLQRVVKDMHECFSQTAENMVIHQNGEERKEALTRLREAVKKHCEFDEKLNLSRDITDSYHNREDLADENILEEYRLEIANIDSRTLKLKNLLEFDRQVEALQKEQDGTQDEELGDEELLLTNDTVNVIDPITKKRMTDPVKNTICGHVYEKQSITELIQLNKRTKCPVAGCISNAYIQLQNLQPDAVTRVYLKKHPA